MSVARTGVPHTSRTPPAPQPALDSPDAALDRTPSGNGHHTPTPLAPVALQDRTTDADVDTAAAPDVRSQVRALVARERWAAPP